MSDARTCPNCHRLEGHHDQANAFADAAYCWASYDAPEDGAAAKALECMRVRAERAERERNALRLELEAVRIHSARHQRERDEEREAAAMRSILERVVATAAIGAEAVHRCGEGTPEEAERISAQAVAEVKAALSGDAGRGALLPTGEAGSEAVEVVGGWAPIDGATVLYAMVGAQFVEGAVVSWWRADNDDVYLVLGDEGEEVAAGRAYRDRSRCIRDAVRALDEEKQRQVLRALETSERVEAASRAADANQWNVEGLIANANPDALLHAYQEEVCR